MSYTPTTWTTGDTITASAMNKIEQGIANAGGGGGFSQYTATSSGGGIELSCSYNDLVADITDGKMPYVVYSGGSVTFAPLLRLDTTEDYQAWFALSPSDATPLVFFASDADGALVND